MDKIKAALEFELFNVNDYSFTIFEIVHVILIFLFTKILIWLMNRAINRRYNTDNLDEGNVYALKHLLKYIIWTISLVLMLEGVGIEASVLFAPDF